MINTIIGLAIGIVFFLCSITAYTIGLKHGKQLSNNQIPKVNLNPVKTIVDAHKLNKEEEKRLAQEKELEHQINNLFSYDGEPQRVGDDD